MATGSPVSFWYGTRAQFDSITTKLDTTLYFITDEQALYKGTVKFSGSGVDTLLTISSTQPSASSVTTGDKYFDTSDNLIHVLKNEDGTVTTTATYEPANGALYYNADAQRFQTLIKDGSSYIPTEIYDAGISVEDGTGLVLNGTTVGGLDATTNSKGVVQLVNDASSSDMDSETKAITPHAVGQVVDDINQEINTKQDNLTFDATTGIKIVGGTTVTNNIATVEEVLTGATGTNIVDADGLTGALSLGQANDVSCKPYISAGSITYTNPTAEDSVAFLDGFTCSSMAVNTQVGYFDDTDHKFPKFATGRKYLLIADVTGSGKITPNGGSEITLSNTAQRISVIIEANDAGYFTASSANTTAVVNNWRQYAVTGMSKEAIDFLASAETNSNPDALFRSINLNSVLSRYLIKQNMVAPWMNVIGMKDNSDMTVAAGSNYKIMYTDDNEHTVSVDTFPNDAYGWDSHIQMFVKGASNVKFKAPLALMDPLISNAGHNLIVKYRNGQALVYVEDTNAGNIVISTSGSTSDTLYYYLQQNPGTGRANYIIFSADTDGQICDAGTVSVPYDANIIGNGISDTNISGTFSIASGVLMRVHDLTVTGSTVNGSGFMDVDASEVKDTVIAVKGAYNNTLITGNVSVVSGGTATFNGINVVDGVLSISGGNFVLPEGGTLTGHGILSRTSGTVQLGVGTTISGMTITDFVTTQNNAGILEAKSHFVNCEITGATSSGSNGAIFKITGLHAKFTNCWIHDNISTTNKDIQVYGYPTVVDIEGCTVDSIAYTQHGGVLNLSGKVKTNLTGSTSLSAASFTVNVLPDSILSGYYYNSLGLNLYGDAVFKDADFLCGVKASKAEIITLSGTTFSGYSKIIDLPTRIRLPNGSINSVRGNNNGGSVKIIEAPLIIVGDSLSVPSGTSTIEYGSNLTSSISGFGTYIAKDGSNDFTTAITQVTNATNFGTALKGSNRWVKLPNALSANVTFENATNVTKNIVNAVSEPIINMNVNMYANGNIAVDESTKTTTITSANVQSVCVPKHTILNIGATVKNSANPATYTGGGIVTTTIEGGNIIGGYVSMPLNISGCTVCHLGNTTGAGIQILSGNTTTIYDALVTGNTASYNAGVYMYGTGPLTISSSVISGNLLTDMTKKERGVDLRNYASGGLCTIDNSEVDESVVLTGATNTIIGTCKIGNMNYEGMNNKGDIVISSGASITLKGSMLGNTIIVSGGTCTVNTAIIKAGTYTRIDSSGNNSATATI